MKNPYIPSPVTIEQIDIENDMKDIKTFRLKFVNEEDYQPFRYLPGQFSELSLFGFGEAPFGIASSPTEEGFVMFTVKKTGTVTSELHDSEQGRKIGIRGPFGNSFPLELMKGKNIVIVGGGFAFTTLRSVIVYMMDERNRKDYGNIKVVYGARSPGEFLYRKQLKIWQQSPDIDLTLTIDRPATDWDGKIGLIPSILKDENPPSANSIALVCGPPIMIHFTIPVLLELGFRKGDIMLSLENRMKCGIGKCGRCNIGHKYVCIDGPVFSFPEFEKLQSE